MYKCWSYEAHERPTFSDIVNEISAVLTLECDYFTFDSSPPPPEEMSERSECKENGDTVVSSCTRTILSSESSNEDTKIVVVNSEPESEDTGDNLEPK